MEIIQQHLGEFFALITAVTWSSAVILFKKSGEAVHPIGLNLFKNILAIVLLLPTIYIFGETLFYDASLQVYAILLLSGAIGIGLADTMYFKCLNTVGAGATAIVGCLYSPAIIILSTIFLGESLSMLQLVGVVMILSAVLTVSREPGQSAGTRRGNRLGYLWGVIAMLSNAVGVLLFKPIIADVPFLWMTTVRLFGGVAVLLIFLYLHPARGNIIRSIRSTHRWVYTLTGSFFGAYVSMMLWLAGMKYTMASVAAALNQSASIITFILAAIVLKEKITPIRVLGIVIGVGGVFLITFG